MKYVKKPVVVEAFQWPVEGGVFPSWFQAWLDSGKAVFANDTLTITSDFGTAISHAGDYVIHGVDGHIYTCSEFVFEQSYSMWDGDQCGQSAAA